MSANLLAKLKVKKEPEKQETIGLMFSSSSEPSKPEEVTIQTTITDKSKTSDFDRNAFLKKIQAMPSTEGISELEQKIQKLSVSEAGPSEAGPSEAGPSEAAKEKEVSEAELGIEEVIPSTEIPIESRTEVAIPEESETLTIKGKKVIKRKTKAPIGVIAEGPATMVKIGESSIEERVAKKEPPVLISASSYYMNNRQIFTNFMSSLFGKYKKELDIESQSASCEENDGSGFSLMTHQKIVRDYLNLVTPYRGLLLYHGLGSGKTCSSIAIAEGMKSGKEIIVMTPASLRMNYVEELKKCGDSLYRKNQYWEFVDINANPAALDTLSNVLSLSVEYIRKQGGAWLVNMTKPANFEELSAEQKKSVDNQLNEMIRYKYKFINYNGLRKSHLEALTSNYSKNPFDNKVVIIDEAHNFVSRIVNKLGRKETLSGALYEYLMDAQNAKIVLLTGTPIINYPNEIAILFNILRGKIKTWYLKLNITSEASASAEGAGKISLDYFKNLFKTTISGGNILDYMEYKPTSTTLVITRNPFGFVNKTKDFAYDGVRISDRGDIDDENFIKIVTKLLDKNGIKVVPSGVRVESFKALPDDLESFKAYFIDDNNDVKNMNLFKRRVMGLSSYFRSAQENLMPAYEKSKNFHVVKIEMSDFQFGAYEEARSNERDRELELSKRRKKKAGKGDVFEDMSSTYRIFSRAFCNFVFPSPDIKRPLPGDDTIDNIIKKGTLNEDDLDATSAAEKLENVDGLYEADDVAQELETTGAKKSDYERKIEEALKQLEANKDKFFTPEKLAIYSPKFLNILENIQDPEHKGLHLVYSQFRTLEGIGILKLVLEANGFAQFKIKKIGEQWQLDIKEEDMEKPKFVLYTGTEGSEEKEIVRNIFNGAWKYVPNNIATSLQNIAPNNNYGNIIKVFMITSSGAEGISLKNVRYVHITEPYWHPVRIEQVIGRARRICSHQELPEELRTVDVFLYLMVFSKAQMESDDSIELRLKDKSKIDNKTPVTSDQTLYEIATIKEDIINKILLGVKESSFDCALHSKAGAKEQLQCFSFGKVNSSKFSYNPSISEEEADVVSDTNKVTITWKAVEMELDGIKYALRKENGEVYDLDSYKRGQPVQVGKLTLVGTGKNAQYKFERI